MTKPKESQYEREIKEAEDLLEVKFDSIDSQFRATHATDLQSYRSQLGLYAQLSAALLAVNVAQFESSTKWLMLIAIGMVVANLIATAFYSAWIIQRSTSLSRREHHRVLRILKSTSQLLRNADVPTTGDEHDLLVESVHERMGRLASERHPSPPKGVNLLYWTVGVLISAIVSLWALWPALVA